MLPSDSRSQHPGQRARCRTQLAALERLESRTAVGQPAGLLASDLTISGSVGTPTAWGGSLGVIATVVNQGTSTITNPIAQAAGSLTTADAPASTVAVVITPHRASSTASPSARSRPRRSARTASSRLPRHSRCRLARRVSAAQGHTFFVHLIVNSTSSVLESDRSNNFSKPLSVKIVSQALPELRATGLSVQSPLEPGDTIEPTITVANLGTAATSGPVDVALVASTTPSFRSAATIVALYEITASIPAASQVPPSGVIQAFSQTATILNNSYTFTGPAVTLPTSPAMYYLGVVVNPYGKIQQLSTPANALSQIDQVGPDTSGLPPAGVISTGNPNAFPLPASGVFIGINPTATTTTSGTSSTKPSTLF